MGEKAIWVIDNLEGVVRRIDPEDLVAGEPIQVGARPRGVVADSGSIWVTNSEDGTVTRIDESTRRQVGEPIKVGAGPADISRRRGLDLDRELRRRHRQPDRTLGCCGSGVPN